MKHDPQKVRWTEFPAPGIVYLDAYLCLPPDAVAAARGLNRQLSQSGTNAVDLSAGATPHITLYMGLFPHEAVAEIHRRLADLVARVEAPLTVTCEQYSVSREGYIFWDVVRDPALMSLHEAVLAALNPLRAGLVRAKFSAGWDAFTDRERANLCDCGFPWVGAAYSPHLTIGVLSSTVAATAVAALPKQRTAVAITEIGLGPVGDWGTVVGETARFALGKDSLRRSGAEGRSR